MNMEVTKEDSELHKYSVCKCAFIFIVQYPVKEYLEVLNQVCFLIDIFMCYCLVLNAFKNRYYPGVKNFKKHHGYCTALMRKLLKIIFAVLPTRAMSSKCH